MDVKSAFLNGYLEEEIFVEQPEGFSVAGQENQVYQLKKALYGLKQAPRNWYSRIDAYLQNLGFTRSLSESTLYVKKAEGQILVVSLYVDDLLITGSCREQIDYVDDLLITGSCREQIDKFKEEMKSVFEMTDL